MRLIDKGFVELDYEVEKLGPLTLYIQYKVEHPAHLEPELEIVEVTSPSGQPVETLFDEDSIYQECWEALEL